MKSICIVGLGNPPPCQQDSNHNIGFITADLIRNQLELLDYKNKFGGLFSLNYIEGVNIILFKPMSFMNNSGESLRQLVNFYKIPSQCIVVIHDDIDLSISTIKIKKGGGSGGHNGIRSIDKHIGNDYWRIRIGVGRPKNKEDVSNYVLSKTTLQKENLQHIPLKIKNFIRTGEFHSNQ